MYIHMKHIGLKTCELWIDILWHMSMSKDNNGWGGASLFQTEKKTEETLPQNTNQVRVSCFYVKTE